MNSAGRNKNIAPRSVFTQNHSIRGNCHASQWLARRRNNQNMFALRQIAAVNQGVKAAARYGRIRWCIPDRRGRRAGLARLHVEMSDEERRRRGGEVDAKWKSRLHKHGAA